MGPRRVIVSNDILFQTALKVLSMGFQRGGFGMVGVAAGANAFDLHADFSQLEAWREGDIGNMDDVVFNAQHLTAHAATEMGMIDMTIFAKMGFIKTMPIPMFHRLDQFFVHKAFQNTIDRDFIDGGVFEIVNDVLGGDRAVAGHQIFQDCKAGVGAFQSTISDKGFQFFSFHGRLNK